MLAVPRSSKVLIRRARSYDPNPPTLTRCYFETTIATTGSLSHEQTP